MLVIGLTGGFATGKSTVAGMLEKLGAKVLNADAAAKRMLWRNSPCFNKVVTLLGKDILTDGRIDRKKVAQIVFSDRAALKKLEAVIHPAVGKEFRRRIKRFKAQKRYRFVVLDVPLLFESGIDRLADVTVTVKSTQAQQIARAVKKHKLTRIQVERRIKAQMPLHDKVRRSDFCIDNSDTQHNTYKQVKGLWLKLQQMAKKQR